MLIIFIATRETYRQPAGKTETNTQNLNTSRVGYSDATANKNEEINDLLQELDNDDFGSNYDMPKASKIKINNRGHQQAMRELDESPLVNDRKLEEQAKAFNMDSEFENPYSNNQYDSGFNNNEQNAMIFDNNDEPEPFQNQTNFGDNDFNTQNRYVEKERCKNKEQPPKSFALDDLMDDFEQSRGTSQIKINPMHDDREQVDDLLAEFEW
jgi:hypothetical protein